MFEALLGIHRPYMLHTHTHTAQMYLFFWLCCRSFVHIRGGWGNKIISTKCPRTICKQKKNVIKA